MDNSKDEPKTTQLGAIDIQLSQFEIDKLKAVSEELKPFELAWLRTYKANGWEPTQQNQKWKFQDRREAFRQGWNAQVYMKTGAFVLNKTEVEHAAREQAKIDATTNPL